MPQMMPIFWLIIYILLLLFLMNLIFLFNSYFMMNFYKNNPIKLKKLNKKKFIFKWN